MTLSEIVLIVTGKWLGDDILEAGRHTGPDSFMDPTPIGMPSVAKQEKGPEAPFHYHN